MKSDLESPEQHKDTIKIENGILKVKMACSQCDRVKYIDRDKAERYYDFDDNEFICPDCQF